MTDRKREREAGSKRENVGYFCRRCTETEAVARYNLRCTFVLVNLLSVIFQGERANARMDRSAWRKHSAKTNCES